MTDALLSLQRVAPYVGLAAVGVCTVGPVVVAFTVAAREGRRGASRQAIDAEPESTWSEQKTEGGEKETSPKKGEKKGVWAALSLLARPLAACAAIAGTCANPKFFQQCGAFPALLADYAATSVTKALPTLYVSGIADAFAFGSLSQRALAVIAAASSSAVSTAASAVGETPAFATEFAASWAANASSISSATRQQIESLLAEASAIVGGGRAVTLNDLLSLHSIVAAQAAHKSVSQRILGVFSVANTLYLVSIIGMTVLFAPALAAVADAVGLMRLINAARRLIHTIYTKVLVPLYHRSTPLIETAAYYAAVLAFVEGTRYAAVGDRLGMGGALSAATGVCLFGLSWFYSLYLRAGRSSAATARAIESVTLAMLTAICGAGAISHDSTLLGYAAVLAFLRQTGVFVAAYPLFVVIGFDSERALIVSAQSSLALLTCFGLQRAVAGTATGAAGEAAALRLVRPFESAASVLGASAYMLAIDIYAGLHWRRPAAHALFIGSSVGLTAAGRVLGLDGLANTATVFWVLYGFTVYGTVLRPDSRRPVAALWLFGGFGLLFALSRFVTNNPQLLVGGLLMGASASA